MNKKYFMHLLAVMMVAMLSVGFASCGGDDDDTPAPAAELPYDSAVLKTFEGTWGLYRIETLELENGYTKYFSPEFPSTQDDRKLVITRSADNKLNFIMYAWDENKNDWSQSYSGFVLDGSKTRAGGVEYLPNLVIQTPDGTKLNLEKRDDDTLILRNDNIKLTFDRMD